jgi:hypothetical protein
MKRSLLVLIMFAVACGPSSPDDSGGEEATSGDGDGDGDGDAGDGDGDGGDGDGDGGDGDGDGGDGDGDGDLESMCMAGCTHTFECAPNEIMTYYADVPECVADCLNLWGACVPEGTAYLECALGLDCPEVITLVADGPSTSACGASFNAAIAACMNG